MSHTTSVKTVKVTDIRAMEAAVQHMNETKGTNLKMVMGGEVQLWFEKQKCAFVINVPGVQRNLNVGFQGNEAEGYSPVFDSHGGWIAKYIGGGKDMAKTQDEHNLANIGGLMHAYAVQSVRNVASSAGSQIDLTYNNATGETVMLVA
jgi:hypothetical protein